MLRTRWLYDGIRVKRLFVLGKVYIQQLFPCDSINVIYYDCGGIALVMVGLLLCHQPIIYFTNSYFLSFATL